MCPTPADKEDMRKPEKILNYYNSVEHKVKIEINPVLAFFFP